jgi:hypothetical protein
MDGWMHGRVGLRTCVWTDGRVGERTGWWMDGCMEGWIDRSIE